VAPARAAARRFNEPEPSVLSARAVQRLPAIVLGALGAGAVSILALMWVTADSPAPRVVQAPAEVALEPAARRELPTPEAAQPVAPAVPVTAPAQPRLVERGDPPAPPDAAVAPSAESTATTPAALPVRPAAAILPPAPREPEVVASAQAAARAVAPASVPDAKPAPVAARSEPPAPTPRPAPSAQVAAAPAADPAPLPMPAQTPVPAPAQTTPTVQTQATAAAMPAATTAANAPALDGEVAARAVAREFSRAYGAGDINALMQLFTADARNNRGGRDAIVYDYQSLFSGTSQRELRLVPAGWISRDPAEGTLLADYEASVTRSGARKSETSRGQIRFDLRRVNGDYRISQVRHDDR
jgi:hypothetical protein